MPTALRSVLLLAGLSSALPAQALLGQLITEQSRATFAMEGAGARAMGLGGAFTAVADDATAVSFNPGGLAQLGKPEATFVYQGIRRAVAYEDFNTVDAAGTRAVQDSSHSHSQWGFRFASLTWPFRLGGRNLVVQGSFHRLVSFDDQSTRSIREAAIPDQVEAREVRQSIDQRGGISTYDFAAAYEFSQRILVGAAYHRLWGKWTLDAANRTTGSTETYANYHQANELRGHNWTLGLLWRSPRVRLGLTYHTAFDATYRFATQGEWNLAPGMDLGTPLTTATLHWPSTLQWGVAVSPKERWQVAFDWSRTAWSRFSYEVPEWGGDPVNFLDERNPTLVPQVTNLRLGLERLLVTTKGSVIPLRMGLFREPQPIVDAQTGSQRVLEGVSVGTGWKRRGWALDVAYRYARSRRDMSKFLELDDLLLGTGSTSLGRERFTLHRLEVSLALRWDRVAGDLESSRWFRWIFIGD